MADYTRFSLAANGIALEVDPADGGRITSLIAHEREWLAPSRPRGLFESFVAAGTGGWDEIAPTVQPATLSDGTALRDHGDAWRAQWWVRHASPVRLTMAVDLPSIGVRLERDIRASDGGIRFNYRATTSAPLPVPLLWSAHPLFDASGGARIVASGVLTEEYPARGVPVSWPREATAGSALKAFVSGVAEASVVHPDGVALHLSWSLPHVGFYWDGGEFSGVPVVSIEPTTGASDSAARAVGLPTVALGSPLSWWVELAL